MKTDETLKCDIDSNMLDNFESYKFPKAFSCGEDVIDVYYKSNLKRALKSENVNAIGAISSAGDVVGFCTLTLSDIDRAKVRSVIPGSNLPSRIAVVRLVMLGVDKKYQGIGIGQRLLMNAFIQAVKVHKQIPIKGVYLDSAPSAVKFYESLGFKKIDEPDENQSTPMILGINAILKA
ncbi:MULTISPECIES: GNAT family N-acetyltransferase [unclassified Pseudomonas]|uniref:GNAT family N-acetyltransferase n=1 Tax=unclassified Pseudomonas TaxID=196821 RepID=UPI000C2FB515|nr:MULTISPECIES: GNAT family N-acetyltransferase [unclassified Pseudomonas]MCU1740017.1 GNAT family N-acetyltransferase [Pseudomonas sp. 20S_6.2_Bac1]